MKALLSYESKRQCFVWVETCLQYKSPKHNYSADQTTIAEGIRGTGIEGAKVGMA